MHSILCISFHAFHYMHFKLCISLYAFHSMHFIHAFHSCISFMHFILILYYLLSLLADRPTDGQTFSRIELLSQLKNWAIKNATLGNRVKWHWINILVDNLISTPSWVWMRGSKGWDNVTIILNILFMQTISFKKFIFYLANSMEMMEVFQTENICAELWVWSLAWLRLKLNAPLICTG
jgi:hypothetical protein